MVKQNFLSRIAFFASAFALAVIALGAFTRLIDAGLGCPDWPGCYGQIIVPAADHVTGLTVYKAWAEMIHRYFVLGLSLFIVTLVAMVFKKNYRTRGNILLAVCLIVFLIYQIILGRWTVTLKLYPFIVTQHLIGGFLILSVLWMMYLNGRSRNWHFSNISYVIGAIIGLIILFFQIFLGAWTSTHYASLSCLDFPFCSSASWFPAHFKEAFTLFSPMGIDYEGGLLSTSIRQTIQMSHRVGALIFTIYMIIFSIVMIKNRGLYTPRSLFLLLGLLLAQISLGIINIMLELPLFSAICHTVIGALLLLTMITLIFDLLSEPRK